VSENRSLVTRIASRFGVDNRKFYETLKATAFKQRDGSAPSDEQMMTLLIVAEQYGLNPFTREIYAFPDKQNGVIPVVGVDGWSRIINEHAQYDGIEFVYADKRVRMPMAKVDCPEWIECLIYRKDRSRPIRIKEFLDEVYREPFQGQGRNGAYTVEGPWQTHTKRQLRHKALIQCSRIAFGFSGIYDQDEAEGIRDLGHAAVLAPAIVSGLSVAHPHSHETLSVEHKALDPLLNKLVSRASAKNAWSAAHEYVKGRYTGSELLYAVQFLREKEMDSLESPLPPNHEVQEPQEPGAALAAVDMEPAGEEESALCDEAIGSITEDESAEGHYY